jgi:TonB family protein
MFDRLIESDTAGAEFKSRRRYFLVSTVVVGALFVSAVVFSIYASEVSLGNDSYELTALLTPVQPPADAPEPPQPQQPRQTSDRTTSDVPIRIVKQQSIDIPTDTVPPVSTSPNKYLSIPNGIFQLGPVQTDPPPGGPINNVPGTGSLDASPNETRPTGSDKAVATKADPPPPVEKPNMRSLGVVNGIATSLPKPPYPAPAAALHVEGKVNVQIMIDETGKVISAKAIDGNPLLRQASEKAALGARFKPTTLSNVPVKVTGVIVYNFTRN